MAVQNTQRPFPRRFTVMPDSPDHAHNTEIPFERAAARHVAITAHGAYGNWGDRSGSGLSEARFNLAQER